MLEYYAINIDLEIYFYKIYFSFLNICTHTYLKGLNISYLSACV